MARHILTHRSIQLQYYPTTTTSSSSQKTTHKRVHSSSHHPSEPPSKRRPSPTFSTAMITLSPSTSPTPTYAYIVLLTLTPTGPFPQPIQQNHGVFTQLSDANAKVSRLRLEARIEREALKGYKAEFVDGALSWSVEWGGMRWEGLEVMVRRVEVRSTWGSEFEGLSLVSGGEEDEVMS